MTMHKDGLLRATPQSRGVDPNAIATMLETIEREGLELHSLLIWSRNALVSETYWLPFAADRLHMMHSVTKSFTSMAVGLAVGDGRLDIDDAVLKFFPEHRTISRSPRLERMTVRHLLTMTSGHSQGISGGAWRRLRTSWVADFLGQPMVHEPGEVFVYDSAASYMLSAIVQKVTGRPIHDYLAERIFRPMNMSDDMRWDLSPEGINSGGNGLRCRTADLLKLGILHLQGGMWNDKVLLSPDWVEMAVSAQIRDVVLGVFTGDAYLGPDETGEGIPAVRREGYGFQWWRGPYESYSANGLFGQYCIVLPDQQTVIAFTAGIADDDRRVHELIFETLRPALSAIPIESPSAQLEHKPARFKIQPGPDTADAAPRCWQGEYSIEANQQQVEGIRLALGSARHSLEFTLVDHRGTHVVEAGFGHWVEGSTTISGARLHHSYEPDGGLRVLACARWIEGDDGWMCLEMDWLFIETAFRDTVRCWLKAGVLRVEREVNVNSAERALPPLEGSAVDTTDPERNAAP